MDGDDKERILDIVAVAHNVDTLAGGDAECSRSVDKHSKLGDDDKERNTLDVVPVDSLAGGDTTSSLSVSNTDTESDFEVIDDESSKDHVDVETLSSLHHTDNSVTIDSIRDAKCHQDSGASH